MPFDVNLRAAAKASAAGYAAADRLPTSILDARFVESTLERVLAARRADADRSSLHDTLFRKTHADDR